MVLSGVLIATSVVALVFVTCVTMPTQFVLLKAIGKALAAFSGKIPHCTEQWGTTERPANYTVTAKLPIAYTSTAYIILGIGIVAPDDNNAKNVSNIYNLTTKTSVSFRTENENAPSVRYITIGR